MNLTSEELELALSGRVIGPVKLIKNRLGCSLEDAHNVYKKNFPIKPIWIRRFMEMAILVSTWSKDPSTKCGTIIVDTNGRIVSEGFNGFPQKFPDSEERYEDREKKYNLIVHSEINAIIFANKPLDNCVMFCSPMIPCCRCAAAICQTGIKLVVFPKLRKGLEERWAESAALSKELFSECGVNILEIP